MIKTPVAKNENENGNKLSCIKEYHEEKRV